MGGRRADTTTSAKFVRGSPLPVFPASHTLSLSPPPLDSPAESHASVKPPPLTQPGGHIDSAYASLSQPPTFEGRQPVASQQGKPFLLSKERESSLVFLHRNPPSSQAAAHRVLVADLDCSVAGGDEEEGEKGGGGDTLQTITGMGHERSEGSPAGGGDGVAGRDGTGSGADVAPAVDGSNDAEGRGGRRAGGAAVALAAGEMGGSVIGSVSEWQHEREWEWERERECASKSVLFVCMYVPACVCGLSACLCPRLCPRLCLSMDGTVCSP